MVQCANIISQTLFQLQIYYVYIYCCSLERVIEMNGDLKCTWTPTLF